MNNQVGFNLNSTLGKAGTVWFSVSTFFGYAAYFFYVPIAIYLGIGISISFFYFFINFKSKVFVFFKQQTFIWLVFFCCVLFASIGYTNAPMYGREKFLIVFLWILYSFFSLPAIVRNLNFFLWSNFIFGVLFLLFLIMEYGNPIAYFNSVFATGIRLGDQDLDDERASLNPIWVARYLGMLIIIAFFKLRNSGLSLMLKIILILSSTLFLLASASKGPIFSLILVLIVCNIEFLMKYKTVIFLIAVFLVYFLIGDVADFKSNSYLFNRLNFANQASLERLEFQHKIFDNISINVFFWGDGLGAAGFLLKGSDMRGYPHNIFIEILYEVGIVILASMFFIIIRNLKRGFRLTKLTNIDLVVCYGLFLFYLLNAQFSGDLGSNKYFFTFLLLNSYLIYLLSRTRTERS